MQLRRLLSPCDCVRRFSDLSLLADDVFKQNAGVCVYCYTGIFFGQLKIKSEHQERIAEDKKDVYPDAVLFADHTCRYAQHRCGAR